MNLPSSSFWWAFGIVASLALAACTGASNPLGGGGPQNCVTTACGNGQSYQVCTSEPAAGTQCSNVTYSVGSQSFPCNTCQGCGNAAAQVVAACENQPPGDDGGSPDAGGNQTCSAATACGTGGRTYQECTTTSTAGTCVSIDYKTSDGKTFTCAGCQNCTDQAENLQNYCSMPQGMSSCSTPVACGSTGMTYKECTTTGSGGACEGIQYELSGGQTFACASCADCNSAVSQLNAACSGSGNPTTACTSWAACSTSTLQYKECTTSVNGACQGIYYQTSDGQQYTCNSCSDCSSAISSMESYCQSMAQPVTSCGTSYTCGSTGVTYQECETTQSGACTAEYFTTSDGQQFNCSGCSCSSAQTSLNSYCSSLGSFTCGTTTCTSGSLCCTCSGVQGCYSSNGGTYTCATYGCQ